MSDIGTKHLESPALDRLLAALDCEVRTGRSEALPQLR